MIGILNYGLGNLFAFKNAYKLLGIECEIINNSSQVDFCSHLILPGVGSFDYAINNFKNSKLYDSVQVAVIEYKRPILGVCVGMQMLFDKSEEGVSKGLSWIPGVVSKFPKNKNNLSNRPFPHIGWNKTFLSEENILTKGINEEEFYFLHSFICIPEDKSLSKAYTKYGIDFTSIVNAGNIYGTQFHPEKSHSSGLKVLSNFYSANNVKV